MTTKYFGQFDNLEDVRTNFADYRWDRDYTQRTYDVLDNFPTEEELLFAIYGGGSYDGAAWVLFRKGEHLFVANGSHCSCMGLEGQWSPDVTSKEELLMQKWHQDTSSWGDFEQEDLVQIREIINNL